MSAFVLLHTPCIGFWWLKVLAWDKTTKANHMGTWHLQLPCALLLLLLLLLREHVYMWLTGHRTIVTSVTVWYLLVILSLFCRWLLQGNNFCVKALCSYKCQGGGKTRLPSMLGAVCRRSTRRAADILLESPVGVSVLKPALRQSRMWDVRKYPSLRVTPFSESLTCGKDPAKRLVQTLSKSDSSCSCSKICFAMQISTEASKIVVDCSWVVETIGTAVCCFGITGKYTQVTPSSEFSWCCSDTLHVPVTWWQPQLSSQ